MIEIYNKDQNTLIKNSESKILYISLNDKNIKIDDFVIDFPWEYEKSWMLVEVKEYQDKLFYSLVIESKHIVVIFDDKFEMKEEIMTFFWDVDLIIINATKDSSKIVENIESRIVLPIWESKDIYLNSMWQVKEELEVFKIKWDFWDENTEFVNLKY